MGTTGISFVNINEVVFENRFRQYGAYMLRKTYSDRLMIAVIAGISIVLLIVTSPLIAQLFKGDVITVEEKRDTTPLTMVREIEIVKVKPEIPKELPKSRPAPPVKGVSSSIVVSNTIDPDKKINLVNDSLVAGDPDGKEPDTKIKDDYPKNPGPATNGGETETPVVLVAEVNPEPTCDIRKHLASNLVYPAYAKDIGVQGTVYVSFIVDEKGQVTDVKTVRDIGYGCGEAAVNAVKTMCAWKPGKMGGRPVKVLYNLPVKFTLH